MSLLKILIDSIINNVKDFDVMNDELIIVVVVMMKSLMLSLCYEHNKLSKRRIILFYVQNKLFI